MNITQKRFIAKHEMTVPKKARTTNGKYYNVLKCVVSRCEIIKV